VNEPTVETLDLDLDVIEAMRVMGLRLVASDHPVLHYWGLHLLSDYRGLRLLAEKYS
jgi:hypothetical protein